MNVMKYFLYRFIALIGQIIGSITVIVFATSLIPYDISIFFTIGDIDEEGNIGQEAKSQEEIEIFKEEIGLNKGPVERLYDFLYKLFVKGDLGESWYGNNEQVINLYFDAFFVTISYFGLGIIIFTIFAIILGIFAAKNKEGGLDKIVRASTSFFYSFPPFVLGTLLIYVFGNVIIPNLKNKLYYFIYYELGIDINKNPLNQLFNSFFDDIYESIIFSILPILCVILIFTGFQFRLVRIYVSEILNQNYIRTAFAKGLNERQILVKHALKNAVPELITSIAITFPIAFSGVVVLEKVFSIPGAGLLLIESGLIFNWPVLIGGAIIFTSLNGLIMMFADLIINLIDPRLYLENN